MNALQQAIALSYEKPQLVDFSAEWCTPCQWLKPVLEEMKANEANPCDIVEIDIDAESDLAESENIKSVPTLRLYHEGELKATYRGMMYKQGLLKWIQESLNTGE